VLLLARVKGTRIRAKTAINRIIPRMSIRQKISTRNFFVPNTLTRLGYEVTFFAFQWPYVRVKKRGIEQTIKSAQVNARDAQDNIPGKMTANIPIPQRQLVTLSTASVKFPLIQVLIYLVSYQFILIG
jgi:hypothetical protein